MQQIRPDCFVYTGFVHKVIDGDTLEVVLDHGFEIQSKQTLRLAEINCPELKTKEGQEAKAFVEQLFSEPKPVSVATIKTKAGKDKADDWRRYLAYITFIGEDGKPVMLNQLLIEKGLAKPYKASEGVK